MNESSQQVATWLYAGYCETGTSSSEALSKGVGGFTDGFNDHGMRIINLH
jgi:hypothetical protein